MDRKAKIIITSFSIILVFCAVVIISLLFHRNSNTSTQDPNPNSIERVVVRNQNLLKSDLDNDGLKDWEEELWKTDAKNPDTDGDGANDGSEIALIRDPRKPGPDDALDFTIQQKELGIIQVSSYVQQQTGIAKSTTTTTSTTIKPSVTVENSLKTYGNAVASILRTHFNATDKETAIFSAVIEKGQKEELPKLLPIAQKYRNLSEQIKKTVVPESAESLQQNLADSYIKIAEEMENLVQNQANYSKEAVFFEKYSASMNNYGSVFYSYMDFFKKNNVRFSPNEPGYLFTPVF